MGTGTLLAGVYRIPASCESGAALYRQIERGIGMTTEELQDIHSKSGLKQVIQNDWWANDIPRSLQELFVRTGLMRYSFDLPRDSQSTQPLLGGACGYVWTWEGFRMLRQARKELEVQALESARKRLEGVA